MPVKIGTHQFKATNAQNKLKGKKPNYNNEYSNQLFNRTGPIKIPAAGAMNNHGQVEDINDMQEDGNMNQQ
jgi:hypothetical protein